MRTAFILTACLAWSMGFIIGAVMGYRLCNRNWIAALEKLGGGF